MKLTRRNIAFIDEYMNNGGIAVKAYLFAYQGVTENTARREGSRLLSFPHIQLEIQNRQAILNSKQLITREQLLKDLIDIKESQKLTNPPSALKSIEIINKMLGFNEPSEIKVSGNLNLELKFPNLENTSDDNEPESNNEEDNS